MDKKAVLLSVLAYEAGFTKDVISDEKALLRDEEDILLKSVDLIQDLKHELVKERRFALQQKAAQQEPEPPITRKDLFAAAMFAGLVAASDGSRPVMMGGAYQDAETDSIRMALDALQRGERWLRD